MKRAIGALVALVFICVLSVGAAKAVPIHYTMTATVAGSLNGVDFSPQQITLSGTGFEIRPGMAVRRITFPTDAMFALADGRSGVFTAPISLIQSSWTATTGYVAFGDSSVRLPMFALIGSAFLDYDLIPIGLVTGAANLITSPISVPTTAGDLRIEAVFGNGTFSAVETPLPPAFAMMLPVLAAGYFAIRRKSKSLPQS